MITLERICRYPVKGLRPDIMAEATLEPGKGLALDRRYALAKGSAVFDGPEPHWMPKNNFLMLANNEKLAQLTTAFEGTTLSVFRKGKQVAKGDLATPMGRTIIEDFFSAFLGDETQGKPRVVEMEGERTFWDTPKGYLTIINADTVTDIERVTQAPLDLERFRGNLEIKGAGPWAEFEWIDKEIQVGDVRLKVTGRVDRCAATTVNPETAERDVMVPRALMKGFGHADCGVFCDVLTEGTIRPGDGISLL